MITLEFPDGAPITVNIGSGGAYETPEQHGWVPASTAAESTAAVQSALDAAATSGKRVWLSAKYPISSQIVLPSGAFIEGKDSATCGFLQVTGVILAPMVLAQDVVPPKIHNVGFFGVNYKSTSGNFQPGAFACHLTAACGFDMVGLEIVDCYFENWKADKWCSIMVVDSTSHDIVAPVIRGNRYQSMPGNNNFLDTLGGASIIWHVSGYKDAPTPPAAGVTIRGVVRDGVFDDLFADGLYLKSYIFLWGGTRNCAVKNATLQDFGRTCLSDKGAYAVASYGDRNPSLPEAVGRYDPTGHVYEGLRIVAPYSCGIYMAQVDCPTVRGCAVTGQYDTGTITLPKGAIVVNGATGVAVVESNRALNCFAGVVVTDAKDTSDIIVRDNTVESSTTNAVGVLFSGANSTLYNFIALIAGNTVRLTGSGSIALKSSNGTLNLGDTWVRDNFLSAKLSALSMAGGTSFSFRRLKLNDNHFEGNTQGFLAFIGANPSPLEIGANEYDMRFASSHGLVINGCIKTAITGVQLFRDKSNAPGTYAYVAEGAQGSVQVPFNFDNIQSGQRFSGGALGAAKPTWAADPGTVVHALAPAYASGNMIDRWERSDTGAWFGMQCAAV